MKDTLLNLLELWGPASREQETTAKLAELIRPHVDEVKVDGLGNLYATRNARGGKQGHVLLAASIDQAGGVVQHVEEDGRLRFHSVGTFPITGCVGHTVRFGSGLTGVVCYESHDDTKELAISKCWIEIGASSKEEALTRVKTGEFFVLDRPTLQFGEQVVGAHLKGRAAAAVLLEVARNLQGAGPAVTFAFTVQGAVGPRMGRPVAQQVAPNLTVVVDLTPESSRGAGKLGKGPALRLKDESFILYPHARTALEQAAERAGVALQHEVLSKGGVSEATAYWISGPSHGVGLLGLPARGVHSVGEQIHLGDLAGAAAVLGALLTGYAAE